MTTPFCMPQSLTIYDVAAIQSDVSLNTPSVVSLAATEQIDTSGVQLLLFMYKINKKQDAVFEVVDCNSELAKTLSLFNLPFAVNGHLEEVV